VNARQAPNVLARRRIIESPTSKDVGHPAKDVGRPLEFTPAQRFRLLTCVGFAMAALTLGPPRVFAQEIQITSKGHGNTDETCLRCHTCARPTAEDPCFAPCTRITAEAIGEVFSAVTGPELVLLDELEDRYLPVPFDHRGHAEMAAMTQGCAVCHHYTAEGTAHPACKTCHEIAPARQDIRKPGLKGAYHRQCMNCHREWSHETSCGVCHHPKTGTSAPGEKAHVPTRDDIIGQMHPPIPEPDTAVYDTTYKNVAGAKVVFRHKEHIHRFGFSCAECHHEDSCSRCHEEGKSEAGRPRSLEEHHRPCANCHDMEAPDKCDHCHYLPGEPAPASFDHAVTGWPLGRYHDDKSCRACHTGLRFAKLDRTCDACHAAWGPATFNHRVTGQVLDERHVEFDCAECHPNREFGKTVTCNECHEEDEGVVFPVKRPGPVDLTVEHGNK